MRAEAAAAAAGGTVASARPQLRAAQCEAQALVAICERSGVTARELVQQLERTSSAHYNSALKALTDRGLLMRQQLQWQPGMRGPLPYAYSITDQLLELEQAMARSVTLLADAEQRAAWAIVTGEASLRDAAASLARALAQTKSPGRLLLALRIMLKDGLLRASAHQLQALYALHFASPAGTRALLVEVAGAEAAPLPARVLALQLLTGDGDAKRLSELTAREYLRQCDLEALLHAPALAELQMQYLGCAAGGHAGCFAAGAGGAPGLAQLLPSSQVEALSRLEAWRSVGDLGADSSRQLEVLQAQLLLLLVVRQVEQQHMQARGGASAATAAAAQEGVGEPAPPGGRQGARPEGRRQGQDTVALASHPLPSLPSSPAALPRALGLTNGAAPASCAAQQRIGAELLLALDHAQRQPLVPALQQQLLAALQQTARAGAGAGGSGGSSAAAAPADGTEGGLDPRELLASLRRMGPSQFGSLVEHNPLLAAEAVATACRLRGEASSDAAAAWGELGASFLEACCQLPMSTQSVECMTLIVNRAPPPDEVLHTFAARCIASIDATQDPGRQGRLVKLLCAFLVHLLQRSPASVLGMQEELAAFCIQFSRAHCAAQLYQQLMLLVQEGDERPTGAHSFLSRRSHSRDRDVFIGNWKPLAEWVEANEPGTLCFEMLVADTDPLKIMVYERYTSREAFTEVHRHSAPYLKWKEEQVPWRKEHNVEVGGQSYFTSGAGHFGRSS
eukprot:scaffold3.g6640.t1